MARPTTTPAAEALQPYTVTRAICMAGERVEVGATVHLTRVQGTELFAAGKVTPGAAPSAEPAAEAADAGDAAAIVDGGIGHPRIGREGARAAEGAGAAIGEHHDLLAGAEPDLRIVGQRLAGAIGRIGRAYDEHVGGGADHAAACPGSPPCRAFYVHRQTGVVRPRLVKRREAS